MAAAQYAFLPDELAALHFSSHNYIHIDPDGPGSAGEKSPEWLQTRERFLVTGSQAAALWDLMPSYRWNYKKLLMKNLGISMPAAPISSFLERIMDYGRDFESRGLRAFARFLRVPIYRTGVFFDAAARVAATPDGVVLSPVFRNLPPPLTAGPYLVEVKARANGLPLYDSLPVHFFVQMLCQLWVSGCSCCIYLHGRDQPDRHGYLQLQVRYVYWDERWREVFERRVQQMDADRENWINGGHDDWPAHLQRPEFRRCVVQGMSPRTMRFSAPSADDVQAFVSGAASVPLLADLVLLNSPDVHDFVSDQTPAGSCPAGSTSQSSPAGTGPD